MKHLVRATWVQLTLATLFSGYLKFVYSTLRWTREGHQIAQSQWAQGGGVILCFWHARIPLSPCSWELENGAQDMRALISRSADGEFIAQTMERIGFPAIRGSRKKLSNPLKDKGGSEALREMVRWVKGGNGVAITPDGPHGPATIMGEGTPVLARMTAAPVLLVGLACRPCLRLPSWDQTVLPLPFARAAMVWDGPLQIGRDEDGAAVAADWTARLNAVTDRAEAMLR
jgi:lysophospholipid acyltransferase (LPLAT)-like uncharacterized protein